MAKNPWATPSKDNPAWPAPKPRKPANPNQKPQYDTKGLFGGEKHFEGRDAGKESRKDKKRWR